MIQSWLGRYHVRCKSHQYRLSWWLLAWSPSLSALPFVSYGEITIFYVNNLLNRGYSGEGYRHVYFPLHRFKACQSITQKLGTKYIACPPKCDTCFWLSSSIPLISHFELVQNLWWKIQYFLQVMLREHNFNTRWNSTITLRRRTALKSDFRSMLKNKFLIGHIYNITNELFVLFLCWSNYKIIQEIE